MKTLGQIAHEAFVEVYDGISCPFEELSDQRQHEYSVAMAAVRAAVLDQVIGVARDGKDEWMRQLDLVKGMPEAEARISTATHACHLIIDALEKLKEAGL